MVELTRKRNSSRSRIQFLLLFIVGLSQMHLHVHHIVWETWSTEPQRCTKWNRRRTTKHTVVVKITSFRFILNFLSRTFISTISFPSTQAVLWFSPTPWTVWGDWALCLGSWTLTRGFARQHATKAKIKEFRQAGWKLSEMEKTKIQKTMKQTKQTKTKTRTKKQTNKQTKNSKKTKQQLGT